MNPRLVEDDVHDHGSDDPADARDEPGGKVGTLDVDQGIATGHQEAGKQRKAGCKRCTDHVPVSIWSPGLLTDDIDNTVYRALTISSLLAAIIALASCGRPHPLAEWDPDAFAPGSPTGTWSAKWWPAADEVDANREHAKAAALDPSLPPTVLRDMGPLPETTGLAGAIDLALLRNPETRIAWANARARAAEYGMSRSDWYPTVAAVLDAVYDQSLLPFGGQINVQQDRIATLGVGLELTWTLLDFGRREAVEDEFRNALLASNFMFNRSLQDVVHAVQVNYFELESADGILDASQQDLLLAESVLASTEEKYVVGLATLPEVLMARQSRELAGYEVEAARTLRHQARSELLVTMGLIPGAPIAFELDADAPVPSELSIGVERLIELSMAARPDLAASMAELKQAEAAVASAEAQLAPQVGLVADVNYNWLKYSLSPVQSGPSSGHDQNPTWSVGIVGSWILFEGEERTNRIRAARAEQMAAMERLHQARLLVAGEVWDAYFQWDAAAKQLEWAESLVESSIANLDATLASYEVGLRTMPEVLAAKRSLADAREAFITSRANVLSASADLVHATGDLRIEG